MNPNMTFIYNIFNWTKAAVLINEFGTKVTSAEACIMRLNEKNEEVKTCAIVIFENGKIRKPQKWEVVHLGTVFMNSESLAFAKPTLFLHLTNGETIRYTCCTTKNPKWTTETYWPEEAVKKLM
jgi:hypothetical protein